MSLTSKISSLLSSTLTLSKQNDRSSTESSTESAKLEDRNPRTLDHMLKYRAELTPDEPLLWYPSEGTEYVPYTARQLDAYVQEAAYKYSSKISRRTTSQDLPKSIALLGLANLDYVVTMFAIYRLGHTVVTLSPRLAKEGYEHLLEELDAGALIYHESQKKMANILLQSTPNLELLPLLQENEYKNAKERHDEYFKELFDLDMDKESKNLAAVIHSSGSTGLPKPNRLSHSTLLMAASKNMNMSAFSCVPFFHGFGLNSLHRSIYSGRQFFIYNAAIPLTSKPLIDTIQHHESEIFFCVPYALKLLAETEPGKEALKRCKLVWFAGSACPDDLGDSLTERGIRLVSDYGLSECGPLMTTMRPEDDHAWNYLRPLPHNKPYMVFEERDDDMLELVCLDGMPWKMASNRDDGSYATKDLFEKHPEIEDAYRFVARQDDTLVLSNGEKANPSVPEGKVRQHDLIAEAIMFGSGKSELGMILIRSEAARDMTKEQVLDEVWSTIEKAQEEMPDHGKIVRSMILVFPAGTEYPRTDKGTIIRQQVYRKFAQDIEDAYMEESDGDRLDLNREEMQEFIRNEVVNTLRIENTDELDIDTDLFSLGVDSLQSTQLRRTLQTRLNLKGEKLPMNVVYENPTIKQLSDFITNIVSGQDQANESSDEVFSKMVEKHGNFTPQDDTADGHRVVLTGATGSLGAHLLTKLLQTKSVKKVYCLVRASSPSSAHRRVEESLKLRRTYESLDEGARNKMVALAADLASHNLGLDATVYRHMALEATAVIHAAWPVNFNMSLSSFQSDIVGTKNLLELCLSPQRASPASFSFCSSISTFLNQSVEKAVPESVPSDLTPALNMGYAQSKLVAENLCVRAAEQTGIKAYVLRIGQIIGDSQHGIWNVSEAVPMMIQTAQTIGVLPDIEEVHKWLPVDIVAREILETTLYAKAPPGSVLNIVNPSSLRWKSDFLPMLQQAGLKFQTVSVTEWLDKLRRSEQDAKNNPPIKLLPYFEEVYGSGDKQGRGENRHWDTDNASEYSPTFAAGWQLSQEMVQKLLDYLRDVGWAKSVDSQRDRQASWSSEGTLGDEERPEDEDKDETKANEDRCEKPQIDKQTARDQMYADLTRKDRADSVITLTGDEFEEKVFWNVDQQKFEVRNVSSKALDNVKTTITNGKTGFVEVDIDSLCTGKTLVWSGTRFELYEAQEPSLAQSHHSHNTALSTSPQDTDSVIVPQAGDVLWNSENACFEVVEHSDGEKIQPEVATKSTRRQDIDLEAIGRPKEVVWNSTRFECV